MRLFDSIPVPENMKRRAKVDKLDKAAFYFAIAKQGGYDILCLAYRHSEDRTCYYDHLKGRVSYYRKGRSGRVCKSWSDLPDDGGVVRVLEPVPFDWWMGEYTYKFEDKENRYE